MTHVAPGTPNPGADLAALRRDIDLLKAQFAATVRADSFVIADAARPVAFMVMPFGREDLQVVYDDFIKPVVELRCGLECIRGDDMFGSTVIMEDVLTGIRHAKVIIADLTGQNPNVFYEVGIAHATDKAVLLIAQSLDDVPFDLRHRRVLVYEYTPRGCRRLENQVEEHVKQMLAESV